MRNSLQQKLLFLILCVTSFLVALLCLLSYDALDRTRVTAQSVSGGALQEQAEGYLARLTAENAALNAELLDRTLDDASMMAEIAGGVFSQPDQFMALVSPEESSRLVLHPEGHFTDSGEGYASGFVASHGLPTEILIRDWQLGSVLDNLTRSVLDRNPYAAAAYFVTSNDVSRYFSDARLEGLPTDFSFVELPLYTDAAPGSNPARATIWSDVYDDPAGLGLMVSAIAPVYTPTDEFVGIYGVDFTLDTFASTIEMMRLGGESYSFIINSAGRAIAFPVQAYRDLLGRDPAEGEFGVDVSALSGVFAPVIETMREGDSGMVRVVGDGIDAFVAHAGIPGTDWSLGTVVGSDEVFGAVATLESTLKNETFEQVLYWYFPLTVMVLVVVACAGMLLTYRLTKPLQQLTEAAENIGARRWDTPLPPEGRDEVGKLSFTLRSMATQLQALIGNLEMRVEERTAELNKALEEVQRSTEDKDRMFEELRTAQRLEAIGQLASGVAHEINTPAQYVGDNLEFLRGATDDQTRLLNKCIAVIDSLPDAAPENQGIQEINNLKEEIDLEFLVEEIPAAVESSREGIQQISSIVRSMKDFSHPGDKEKQSVDVNRAIDATVTVAKNEWKYVARIESNLDEELPEIMAHAIEIKQVLLNIIVNAAHAIEKRQSDGGLEGLGTIRIATMTDGEHVTILIRDDGCGIPEDVRARIYDPFYTTKEVGKGTGQGMSIVHRIVVEHHCGEIKIDSEVNAFTEFQLVLPIGLSDCQCDEVAA